MHWRRKWQPTPVFLPGESQGPRSLVGCRLWGHEESDTTERLPVHFSLSCIGEGNGNPLQCSCLENPRDGGAWWATVYGVAQSRTRLKRLSSSSSSGLFCGVWASLVAQMMKNLPTVRVRKIPWRRQWHPTPLQHSCLENPMDRGAWWAAVLGVAKSRTRLSDFTFTSHFHALEKEMETHSSILAWRIPGTEEPGGLPPMGSHRVGHN